MKINNYFLPICFLLNACTERVEPFEVKIPIAVSCVLEEEAEPGWNIPRLVSEASATDKLKAVLADLELSKGYIEELKAELTACK